MCKRICKRISIETEWKTVNVYNQDAQTFICNVFHVATCMLCGMIPIPINGSTSGVISPDSDSANLLLRPGEAITQSYLIAQTNMHLCLTSHSFFFNAWPNMYLGKQATWGVGLVYACTLSNVHISTHSVLSTRCPIPHSRSVQLDRDICRT